MSFFNSEIPIVVWKKPPAEASLAPDVWQLHLKLGDHTIFSGFYNRHDQACLIWGAIAMVIFLMAQFMPINWMAQALFATILTCLGVVGMLFLTWSFARYERLSWVLASWTGLMLIGAIVTYQGMFGGWSWALIHICHLWLGLSGVGYLVTGMGMRSRLFLLLSALHFAAIALLPIFPGWNPLITGIVISLSAFFIAELQWDANGVCEYQAKSAAIADATPSPARRHTPPEEFGLPAAHYQ